MDDDLIAEVHQLLLSGWPALEAAEFLRDHGFKISDAIAFRELSRLRKEFPRDVAHFGIGRKGGARVNSGRPLGSTTGPTPETERLLEQIKELRAQHLNNAQIGARTGFTRAHISKISRKYLDEK